ncbi:transglycosylase domain-containing protein [Thalassobacillus sp. CUG 92003]|uniref:transglycosylase domain-containing protein n=1 Tax=Thalassobacillus sp. CUG 92003 TaxID=2736641 RepID=UPI0021082EAA|nr:PBP1A family penicillin-binding protein [Thalassobacillus sp. CUG 92003]
MNTKEWFENMPAWVKRFRWVIACGAALFVLALAGYLTIIFGGRFVVDDKALVLDAATTVETEDGKVIEEIYTENRRLVSRQSIPEHVENAFIAIEDSRFYEHTGVDVKSVFRAIYRDLRAMEKVEGGSTITQQLAKNLFLSNDKTWMRKTKEVMAAKYLERQYSKEEILELYLNRIYFGDNIYGLGSAAEHFFNKDVADLTVSEGAMLAALPKAPNDYSPRKHPKKAKQRRNLVLNRMKDLEMITVEDMLRYQGASLGLDQETENKQAWSHSYVDLVIQEAEEKYNISREELKRGGYRLVTELDPTIQKTAYRHIQNDSIVPGSLSGVQAAFTMMNHDNGAIVAAIGGKGFEHGGLNRAKVKRSPGSTIKPLAVYGPALMTSDFTPYSVLPDELKTYEDGYQPRNYDGQYSEEVSLYHALTASKNAPAVWLLDQIGISYAKGYLDQLGLATDDHHLAMALGGLSEGYSPLQLSEAYQSFASEGAYAESYTIKKIIDRHGDVIHQHEEETTEVFDKQVAWDVTEMLKTAVREGTASQGQYDQALAGKTGTHQHPEHPEHNKDVWFVGYTPEYVGSVWMGYDRSGKDSYVTGGSSYPTKMMKAILSDVDQQIGLASTFQKPEGVEELPPPIHLPDIDHVEADVELGGMTLLQGTLTWEPSDDERVVYHIYRSKDGADKKVGEVTGKGSFTVNGFQLFNRSSYYVVPYDPLTEMTGTASEPVQLSVGF